MNVLMDKRQSNVKGCTFTALTEIGNIVGAVYCMCKTTETVLIAIVVMEKVS